MDATLGVLQTFVPARATAGSSRSTTSRDPGLPRPRCARSARSPAQMHTCSAPTRRTPTSRPRSPATSRCAAHGDVDEEIERVFLDLPDDDEASRRSPAAATRSATGSADVARRRRRARSSATTATSTSARRCSAATALGHPRLRGRAGRPLLERRRKRSPLRDVAGMLRSFAYAAGRASCSAARRARRLGAARARGVPRRLPRDGRAPSLLPPGEAATDKLLAVFELEKAVYELRYELNNRPDWVEIPVAGIAPPARGARRMNPADPHATLGAHPTKGGVVVRAFRPDAERVTVQPRRRRAEGRQRQRPVRGRRQGRRRPAPLRARGRLSRRRTRSRSRDPIRLPTDARRDRHVPGRRWSTRSRGEARRVPPRGIDGVAGTAFAVWAPTTADARAGGRPDRERRAGDAVELAHVAPSRS